MQVLNHFVALSARLLMLLMIVTLSACGGGGEEGDDNAEPVDAGGFEFRFNIDEDAAGTKPTSVRQGESLKLSIFDSTTGKQDFGVYVSQDHQSYEQDLYTWTVTPSHMARLSSTRGYEVEVTALIPGDFKLTAKNDKRIIETSISVSESVLQSIDVSPTNVSRYKGQSFQFRATGNYSDGAIVDLTEAVTWASSGSVVEVSETGMAKAMAVGEAQVTAQLGDISGSAVKAVTPAAITTLSITESQNMPLGRTYQLQAMATYTDGTTADLTEQTQWLSSNEQNVYVTEAGLVNALSQGTASVQGKIDDGYGLTINSNVMAVTVEDKLLDKLEIIPLDPEINAENPVIALEKRKKVTVQGTYSNQEVQLFSIADGLVWQSSDEQVAVLEHDEEGTFIRTFIEGNTQITATIKNRRDQDVVATWALNVNRPALSKIELTWQSGDIAAGESGTFAVLGTYQDNTTRDLLKTEDVVLTWRSKDTNLADFVNTEVPYELKTYKQGTVQVTAESTNILGELIVSEPFELSINQPKVKAVRIDVAAPRLITDKRIVMPQGTNAVFRLTEIYTDDSEQTANFDEWVLTNQKVVVNKQTGEAVANSQTLDSDDAEAAYLGEVQLIASRTIADNTFSDQITIFVTPPVLNKLIVVHEDAVDSVQKGYNQGEIENFRALGTYSTGRAQDLTEYVTWRSSSDTVTQQATVNQFRLDKQGSATITAEFTDPNANNAKVPAELSFDILAPLLTGLKILTNSTSVASGYNISFDVVGQYTDENFAQNLTNLVAFASSHPEYLNFSDASTPDKNVAKATRPTEADKVNLTVSAELANANQELIKTDLAIIVKPALLEAIRLFIDNSRLEDYCRNMPKDGDATPLSCFAIPAGVASYIDIEASYSDGSSLHLDEAGLAELNINWTVSDESAAKVLAKGEKDNDKEISTSRGVVEAIAANSSFDVKAELVNSANQTVSATLAFTTVAPVMEAINVWAVSDANHPLRSVKAIPQDQLSQYTYTTTSPDSPFKMSVGENQFMVAWATLSDGSYKNITFDEDADGRPSEQVNTEWQVGSEFTRFLKVNNGEEATTAVNEGTVTSLANSADLIPVLSVAKNNSRAFGISGNAYFTMGIPKLRHAAIAPQTPVIHKGDSIDFTVTGFFTDGTSKPQTENMTWRSTDPAIINFADETVATAKAVEVSTGPIGIEMTLTPESQTPIKAQASVVVRPKVLRRIELSASSGYRAIAAHIATPEDMPMGSVRFPMGIRSTMLATGHYSDGSQDNLEAIDIAEVNNTQWSIVTTKVDGAEQAGEVASIDQAGVITPIQAGIAEVTVTQTISQYEKVTVDGRSEYKKVQKTLTNTLPIRIENVYPLAGLEVLPAGIVTEFMPVNTSRQFQAWASFQTLEGVNRVDISKLVKWSIIADPNFTFGTLGSDENAGLFNAQRAGDISINVDYIDIYGDTRVQSRAQRITGLDSIEIVADRQQIYKGETLTLTAYGVFKATPTVNHKEKLQGNLLSWQSLSSAAVFNDAQTSQSGVASVVVSSLAAAELAQIRLDYDDGQAQFSNTFDLTIKAPLLTNLVLSTSNTSVPLGYHRTLSVDGVYSDETRRTLTANEIEPLESSAMQWLFNSSFVKVQKQADAIQLQTFQYEAPETSTQLSIKTQNDKGETITSNVLTFKISEPEIESLSVSAARAQLPAGLNTQMDVSAVLTDGTTKVLDKLDGISWRYDSALVENINSLGVLQTAKTVQSNVSLKAQYNAAYLAPESNSLLEASTSIDIIAPVLSNVEFTEGVSKSIAKGLVFELPVTGTNSDGSRVTAVDFNRLSWSTSNPSAVKFELNAQGQRTGRLIADNPGTSQIRIGDTEQTGVEINNAGDMIEVTVTPAQLQRLKLSTQAGQSTSVQQGSTVQLNVSGFLTDSSEVPVASSAEVARFESSNPSVLTVSSTGVVNVSNSAAQTSVTVTARAKNSSVQDGQITFTVQPPKATQFELSDKGVKVVAGRNHTFTIANTFDAFGAPITLDATDMAKVKWSLKEATDSQFAAVNVSTGQVTVQPGAPEDTRIEIVAEINEANLQVYGETYLFVSPAVITNIEVKGPSEIAAGAYGQYTATGTYSDGSVVENLSTGFVWQLTANTSSAVINSSGRVQAIGTQGETFSVTTQTDSSVTVTAKAVTIAAAAPIKLVIVEDNAIVNLNQTQQFSVKALYSNQTATSFDQFISVPASDLTWVVHNEPALEPVARFNSTAGELLGLRKGVVGISATLTLATGESLVANASVTVSDAVLTGLEITGANSLIAGLQSQYHAVATLSDGTLIEQYQQGMIWQVTSSNAVVDSRGMLVAGNTANETITLTVRNADNSVSATKSVTISSAELVDIQILEQGKQVTINGTHNYTLQGRLSTGVMLSESELTTYFNNQSLTPVWSSSNLSVASVDQSGTVTGINTGTASVAISVAHGTRYLSASSDIKVGDEVLTKVTVKGPETLAFGQTADFNADLAFSDGSSLTAITDEVIFVATDSSNAQTVMLDGQLTIAKNGNYSVVATATRNGTTVSSDPFTVTVSGVLATRLSIDSASNITINAPLTLSATAYDHVGSTVSFNSSDLVWTVSDQTIARIQNGNQLVGISEGVVQINAELKLANNTYVSASQYVYVGSAAVSTVAVTGTSTLAAGNQTDLTVNVTYANGITLYDYQGDITWEITGSNDANITSMGVLSHTASAQVTVDITAQVGGVTSSSHKVTLNTAELIALTLVENNLSLVKGQSQTLTVRGTYSNATSATLAATEVTWQSGNTDIVTVDENGTLLAIAPGTTTVSIFKQVGNVMLRHSQVVTVIAAQADNDPLDKVTVTGPSTLMRGQQGQYAANLEYRSGRIENGMVGDILFTATDASTSTENVVTDGKFSTTTADTYSLVATVTRAGVETTSAAFTVKVSGEYVAELTITSASSTTINAPMNLTFTAKDSTGADATSSVTASDVKWTVDNQAIARINSSNQLVGVAEGTVLVTAEYTNNGITVRATQYVYVGSAAVSTVAITGASTLAAGNQTDLTVNVAYANGITLYDYQGDITWVITGGNDANITSTGVLSHTATSQIELNVTAQVDDVTSSMHKVTLNPAELIALTLVENNLSLVKGQSQTFTVQGTYSDGSTASLSVSELSWQVADSKIATVTSAGTVKAEAPGTTTVRVFKQVGNVMISHSQVITVVEASSTNDTLTGITLNGAEELRFGQQSQYTVDLEYQSGRVEKAVIGDVLFTMKPASGDTTVMLNGVFVPSNLTETSYTINAKALRGGVELSTSVPINLSIANTYVSKLTLNFASQLAVGQSETLVVSATNSDNSAATLGAADVKWTVSDLSVARISGTSLVGVAEGKVTVTAQYTSHGITVSASQEVYVGSAAVKSVAITGANTLAEGNQLDLNVNVTYTNDIVVYNYQGDITWALSGVNAGVSSITTEGVLTHTGSANETASVTATVGGVTSATAHSISLTAAELVSLTLVENNVSLAKGNSQTFTVKGTYSNGTNATLAASDVSWQSANSQIASVTSAGLVKGEGAGSTSISVFKQVNNVVLSSSQVVTVTAAKLSSVTINASSTEIALGNSLTLTASAKNSDDSTPIITSTFWNTASELFSVDSNGKVTAMKAQTSSSATEGDIQVTVTTSNNETMTQSMTLKVVSPVVSDWFIENQTAARVPEDMVAKLNAFAVYSDKEVKLLTATDSVAWSVSSITGTGFSTSDVTIQQLDANSGTAYVFINSSAQALADDVTATIEATYNSQNKTFDVVFSQGVTESSVTLSAQSNDVADKHAIQSSIKAIYSSGVNFDMTELFDITETADTPAADQTRLSATLKTEFATAKQVTAPTDVDLDIVASTVSYYDIQGKQVLQAGVTEQLTVVAQATAASHVFDIQKVAETPASWASSDTTIAEISTEGVVTAKTAGSVTFTATLADSTEVTHAVVIEDTVTSLTVTASTQTWPIAQTNQSLQIPLTATFNYASGNTVAANELVRWSSNTLSVDYQGNVLAPTATGTHTVTAERLISGKLFSESITLTFIATQPTSYAVANKQDAQSNSIFGQFIATSSFNGDTAFDVTPWFAWKTTDTAGNILDQVLGYQQTVSELASLGAVTSKDTNFKVIAQLVGAASDTIDEEVYGFDFSGTTALEIQSSGSVVTEMTIADSASSKVAVYATAADGTKYNVTHLVTWSVDTADLITFNLIDSGEITRVAAGDVVVTATFFAMTTTFTVK